jgi:hypothetical protein
VKETPESHNVSALRAPASEIEHKKLHLPLLNLDTNTPLLYTALRISSLPPPPRHVSGWHTAVTCAAAPSGALESSQGHRRLLRVRSHVRRRANSSKSPSLCSRDHTLTTIPAVVALTARRRADIRTVKSTSCTITIAFVRVQSLTVRTSARKACRATFRASSWVCVLLVLAP